MCSVQISTVIVYAAHKCKFPGCNTVFVMDGNCKNRRDVCGATEAGYIEYPGLPQGCAIKSGCQLPPMHTSRYCMHHTPRVSAMQSLQDPESSSENSDASQPPRQGIVKLIVGKKITRNTTYYQVTNVSNVNMYMCQLNSMKFPTASMKRNETKDSSGG